MALSPGNEIKSSSFAFPQEVYNSFISQFTNDRRTLKTCSYVSRSWLATSRIHLFREVSIKAEQAEKFIQLVQSPSCTFLHLVRALHLIQCERFSQDRLMVLLNIVDNLETLGLERARWYETLPAKDCRATFKHIQTLILTECHWNTIHNWGNFISSFPSLHHLICEYDRNTDNSVTAMTASKKYPLPNPLLSLFYSSTTDSTLQYFASQEAIESVQIFGLWADSLFTSASVIVELLWKMGSSLQKLYISLGGMDADSQDVVLTLKHNTSLQHLDFRVSRSADLALLVQMLSTIRSRVVLRIIIDGAMCNQVLEWPWEIVSPAVLTSSIVKVEAVTRYYLNRATFPDEIRQLLGGIDEKGILQMIRVRHHDLEPWRVLGIKA